MTTSSRLLLFLALSLSQIVLPSPSHSADLRFGDLKWRLIGPFRGGRAVAAGGVVGSGTTFLFGAVDGGVWKTTNAGSTWSPIFDNQPVASIGALEVAPSDPNIIYVGTGESDIRSNLASGDGVYKSSDGGKTWHNIGLKDTRQISRIAIDCNNPNHVLVAALGHAYSANDERGVFVSEDGGESWTRSLFKGPEIGAADVAISDDNPKLVFAAMWEAHRPPWSTYAPISGAQSGLYKSEDGGHTWSPVVGHGLPATKLGRIGIAIARGTNGRRIYASVEAASGAGIYRSDDGGDNWKCVNSDPRLTSRAWYFSSITVDHNDPDVLYVPNVAFYKLSEGGAKVTIVRGAPGGDDYHQAWIDPADSRHMVLASDQGTVVSVDGGATWSTWYNQPTAQIYHVITDNVWPYRVYACQQDSGSVAVPSRTDHGEIDATDFSNIGGSESGYVAPDPQDPDVFFVSGTFGTVDRFDRRTHESQNVAPWPVQEGLGPQSIRKYRDPWTPVLVFSPIQHNALYLGTQYVMRTLDGGLHWQTISPDLTGQVKGDGDRKPEDKTIPSLTQAKQDGFGVIFSLAPSPLIAAQIWAGTDTGMVYLTRNNGHTWTNVTPPGLEPWSKVSMIEASHFDAGEAFLAVDKHRLDDMAPYAFRTQDYGKTWQPITSGIPEHHFLHVIREDSKRKGLLFAGTEFGTFISFDSGNQWESLQVNLPVTSVRDLLIHDNDLIAATHGRSFWIMDDITPLRQLKLAATTTTFFEPAPGVRTISDGFQGTPIAVDEPKAENPPRGAVLDYFVGDGVSGPVSLEILDSTGKLIRRYSSTDKPEPPSLAIPIAPRWLHQPPVLSGEPGLHRFVWDLRYERSGENNADDDDESNANFPGPIVPPGNYVVRLVTGAGKMEKPLKVVLDPRSLAKPADLAEQFTWAKHAFTALVAARKLGTELADAQKRLGTEEASKKNDLAALQTQATSVTREIAGALSAIESSDRLPTSQALELYRQSSARLETLTQKWQASAHKHSQ